jgi:predicted lipoprotein with Yx(FWY)xxD motif
MSVGARLRSCPNNYRVKGVSSLLQSVCYAQCAQAWPPLTLTGKPVLGAGLDQSLVGTITRKGGTKQVTLNGWPLYYFAGDAGPDEHNGQGKFGVWWEVTPAGAAFKG